jgi:flagellar hook-associated protein 1
VDGDLTDFFSALSALSDDPTSSTARETVVSSAEALTSGINEMASNLANARESADDSVKSTVDQINALASTIASLNKQIAGSGGTDAEATLSLQDERTEALNGLAELVDMNVVSRSDGAVDVTIGNGQALVVGKTANAIETATGSDGVTTLTLGGTDITDSVTSGELGGYLEVRDVLVPSYQDALDTLAYTIAEQFNTVNAAGYDLNGDAGGNLFTSITSVNGAALALAVDPDVADDPSLIAASATQGAEGDNTNLKDIVALQDTKVIDGTSTFAEAWANLTYEIGQDSSAAQTDETSASEVVEQITALRDSVSGVSLDEESADLIKFQRAYEANAKYFEYVNSTLDTLMGMLGD